MVPVAAAVVLGGCMTGDARPEVRDVQADDATADRTATAPVEASARPGITTVGIGRTTAVPDVARFVIGVEVSRAEVAPAFDDAATTMDAVVGALRAEGVGVADLRTSEVSVRQQRDDTPPPSPPTDASDDTPGELRYVVTNLVEVTVRDIERVGDLMAAAVAAGGDDVRVHRFALDVDDAEALLGEARSAAFDDARRRAEHYAELSDRRLGELVTVSEVIGAPPGPEPMAVAEDAAAGTPPIEAGEQEFSVRVQTTWSMD